MSTEAAHFPDALANVPKPNDPNPDSRDFRTDSTDLTESSRVACHIAEASDDQLMNKVRNGSREALTLLFRRHAMAVRGVAYRILRNEAEADDLVQEVFLFIFRKATLFDRSQGAARSWIFQVAYHRAFDRRRYLLSRHFYSNQDLEAAAQHVPDLGAKPYSSETSMEGMLGKQLTARLNGCLPPEQRETIQLFFFEGYSLREIAELTGRSLVNVRQHYYRGLARLRKYIPPEILGPK